MNTQIFQYNNNPVTFRMDGDVMANATEMADLLANSLYFG